MRALRIHQNLSRHHTIFSVFLSSQTQDFYFLSFLFFLKLKMYQNNISESFFRIRSRQVEPNLSRPAFSMSSSQTQNVTELHIRKLLSNQIRTIWTKSRLPIILSSPDERSAYGLVSERPHLVIPILQSVAGTGVAEHVSDLHTDNPRQLPIVEEL